MTEYVAKYVTADGVFRHGFELMQDAVDFLNQKETATNKVVLDENQTVVWSSEESPSDSEEA